MSCPCVQIGTHNQSVGSLAIRHKGSGTSSVRPRGTLAVQSRASPARIGAGDGSCKLGYCFYAVPPKRMRKASAQSSACAGHGCRLTDCIQSHAPSISPNEDSWAAAVVFVPKSANRPVSNWCFPRSEMVFPGLGPYLISHTRMSCDYVNVRKCRSLKRAIFQVDFRV
jgi:hypothetical protein